MTEHDLKEQVLAGKITLLRPAVVISVIKDPAFKGRIYIPEEARQNTQLGRVLQNTTKHHINIGDIILYANYTGYPLDSSIQTIWVLEEEHILATVKKSPELEETAE